MKKMLLSVSAFVAAFATAGFADRGLWIPAVGCIGWMAFMLIVNMVKPHAGTRGKVQKRKANTRILYLYDIIGERRFQDEVRKMWEDA